jgi:bacteriorhodopsin
MWWALAMIPFLWIVIELLGGLKSSIDKQPASARGLINGASYLLILSWAFYPVVFVLPMLGVEGSTAATYVQVGYSIADIVAKAVFGVLIFAIAVKKSEAEAHA